MFSKWFKNDRAEVAVEVGLLTPVMLAMIMGMYDTGSTILANYKVVNASQTIGDLLGRYEVIDDETMTQCIEAGRLMVEPYNTSTYGVDIVGIQFSGSATNPVEKWRDTVNASINANIVSGASGLGLDKEGVIGVTVTYTFKPLFSGVLTGDMKFKEVSYVRGRRGLFITRS